MAPIQMQTQSFANPIAPLTLASSTMGPSLPPHRPSYPPTLGHDGFQPQMPASQAQTSPYTAYLVAQNDTGNGLGQGFEQMQPTGSSSVGASPQTAQTSPLHGQQFYNPAVPQGQASHNPFSIPNNYPSPPNQFAHPTQPPPPNHYAHSQFQPQTYDPFSWAPTPAGNITNSRASAGPTPDYYQQACQAWENTSPDDPPPSAADPFASYIDPLLDHPQQVQALQTSSYEAPNAYENNPPYPPVPNQYSTRGPASGSQQPRAPQTPSLEAPHPYAGNFMYPPPPNYHHSTGHTPGPGAQQLPAPQMSSHEAATIAARPSAYFPVPNTQNSASHPPGLGSQHFPAPQTSSYGPTSTFTGGSSYAPAPGTQYPTSHMFGPGPGLQQVQASQMPSYGASKASRSQPIYTAPDAQYSGSRTPGFPLQQFQAPSIAQHQATNTTRSQLTYMAPGAQYSANHAPGIRHQPQPNIPKFDGADDIPNQKSAQYKGRDRQSDIEARLRASAGRVARGLSPDVSNPKHTHNQLRVQFSHPTVPDITDFCPSSSSSEDSTSEQLPKNAHGPADSMTDETLVSTNSAKSTLPTSPRFGPEKLSDDLLLRLEQPVTSQHVKKDASMGYAIDCLPVCSMPCNDDCSSECSSECSSAECDSCEAAQPCYKPCSNPELCSSIDCNDMKCFECPQPACTSHHTPPSFAEMSTIDPSSIFNPQTSSLEDQSIGCPWTMGHSKCASQMPTVDALDQHVLQSHIKPQNLLPCEWDECHDLVDVHRMPDHLWNFHSPIPQADSYICLWQACGLQFSTSQKLDEHIKAEHCHMTCKWADCAKVTTTEKALTQHVDNEHLARVRSQAAKHQSTTPIAAISLTPGLQFSVRCVKKGQTTKQTTAHRSSKPAAMSTTEASHPPSQMEGKKTCQWITDPSTSTTCGLEFRNGNVLQDHVENAHFTSLKQPPNPSQTHPHPKPLCHWQGCPQTKPFQDRTKLSRHTYSHTNYAIGACRHCNKKFTQPGHLTDHERTHTQHRPFTCPECGWHATSKTALATHKRIHTGAKPLVCETCGYTCGDPSNMSKHRKIHRAPLFDCGVCRKGFCRRATLRRHELVHGEGGGEAVQAVEGGDGGGGGVKV